MSTPNRTQNSEKSFPEPLIFGTVFTNEKFVPIRAEIWSMFNKVQVVELAILTWILLNSKCEFMLILSFFIFSKLKLKNNVINLYFKKFLIF